MAIAREPAGPQPILGRVLVVDDDRRMASGRAEWLCSQGWHASAVGSADEALRSLRLGRFDACVVDAALPAGGAARLAKTMRETAPAVGIVAAA